MSAAIVALSLAVICLAVAQVITTAELRKHRKDLDTLFEGGTYMADSILWLIRRSK